MGSWILSKRMGYMYYSPDPGEQVKVPLGKTWKIGTVIDVTFPPSRRARILFHDTGQHVSVHMRVVKPLVGTSMDRAVKLGPYVGYDVAANPWNPDLIEELRVIASSGTSGIVQGVRVDCYTAGLVVGWYDRAGPNMKRTMERLPVAHLCWAAVKYLSGNGDQPHAA